MHLPTGWHVVQADEAAALEAEIARELCSAHALAGVKLSAIARNLGRDDVLFANLTTPPEVHWVHLTWSAEKEPRWPHTERYGSLAEFVDRWTEESTEEDPG